MTRKRWIVVLCFFLCALALCFGYVHYWRWRSDMNFGVYRQALLSEHQGLWFYQQDKNPSFDDPVPTWDMIRPYLERRDLNPNDHRLGTFLSNGYRDNYGNPISIVKVRSADGSFCYKTKIHPKSLERLRKDGFPDGLLDY